MRIPDQLRRLACRHFDRDEVASLRSLLSLLAPYLKAEWQVVDGDDADLVLVRLDAPAQAIERNVRGGPRAIACVRRPREALVPAIHRPLRASEILTVLNEAEQSVQPQPSVLQEGHVAALAYWPIEFEDWPSSWSRVLAAIAGGPRDAAQIAQVTQVSAADVANCLAELKRLNALVVTTAPLVPPPRRTGFRGLLQLVGRKLGFSHE